MEEARPDVRSTRVGSTTDVPAGAMVPVTVEGRPLVVANIGDELVAFQDSCLHARVRLSEGLLAGDVVTCRWHQWQYCVRTGDVLTDESPYATFTTFPVLVDDGDVFVEHTPKTRITVRPEAPEGD